MPYESLEGLKQTFIELFATVEIVNSSRHSDLKKFLPESMKEK